MPTLIISADYNLDGCHEIADLMEEEISGSKKILIKNAGHCSNMNQPEEFNRILINFILTQKSQ